jgi:hypothetical protein
MTDRQEIRARALDAAVHFVDMLRPTRLFTVGTDGTPSTDDFEDEESLNKKVFNVCKRFEDFILSDTPQ